MKTKAYKTEVGMDACRGSDIKPIASPVNWLMAAAVILLGAGCASSGTKRQATPVTADCPESGKGLVVFYRESQFKGGIIGYAVRDFDEKPHGTNALSQARIGGLPNGSYFVYQATPGQHVFAGSRIELPTVWQDFFEGSREYPNFYCCEVNVESNTTYYVQLRFTLRTFTPKLEVVDSQKGSAAIKNLKRVKLSDKPRSPLVTRHSSLVTRHFLCSALGA